MLSQLKMDIDGRIGDKVDMAIRRLQAFEPEDGYFVAFSGGKDSQCIYHLCNMAGVKFDAHYHVTSVDPPELIYFIRKHYPDVVWDIPHDRNGRRISMWSLIPEENTPPSRWRRYCCRFLKEANGKGRITVTGVRWAESAGRRKNRGTVVIHDKPKATQKKADELGASYRVNDKGGLVMNEDNDENRRMAEFCYRTQKTILNPIVDWTDEDVWEFLNEIAKVPHCTLYDEGFKRVGCIGCPLAGTKSMIMQFERYPKYRKLYLRAFEKMLAAREKAGLEAKWETAEDVFNWWIGADSRRSPLDEYFETLEV